MKTYLHAFAMCQSMFCAIPAPQVWDEKEREKMLLFLPIVGLEIGAIWAGLAWLCRLLNLPTMITALILAAYPYIVTGFLHLDGYMDVTDAVKSWRDLERRREILKDSHVGSFAVIGIVLLLVAQFAVFASAPVDTNYLILIFIPAVSRCCSALAVTGLKPMSTSQYADQRKPKSHMVVLTIICSLSQWSQTPYITVLYSFFMPPECGLPRSRVLHFFLVSATPSTAWFPLLHTSIF